MEFLNLLFPLAGAMLLLVYLAKLIAGRADKDRTAQEAAGRIEFAPNRRSYWGVYAFVVCFGLVTIAGLVSVFTRHASLAGPAITAGFILLLLMAFPATIVVDEKGMEQVFWLRGRKRIAWKEVSRVALNEKSGEVRIFGKSGVKIVHTRQLPDQTKFMAEVEKHRAERAEAPVAAPAFAISGPAA